MSINPKIPVYPVIMEKIHFKRGLRWFQNYFSCIFGSQSHFHFHTTHSLFLHPAASSSAVCLISDPMSFGANCSCNEYEWFRETATNVPLPLQLRLCLHFSAGSNLNNKKTMSVCSLLWCTLSHSHSQFFCIIAFTGLKRVLHLPLLQYNAVRLFKYFKCVLQLELNII